MIHILRKYSIFLLMVFTQSNIELHANSISVTYIANCGFLLSSDSSHVLIDAIFMSGFNQFDVPSADLRASMIHGDAPFEDIDLILATHVHADHYYSPGVIEFLENHQESYLLGSPHICMSFELQEVNPDCYTEWALELGGQADTTIQDIPIKFYRLRHASNNGDLQNYAYLITINGMKIFHMGDAGISDNRTYLESFNLLEEDIDVLLVPYFGLSPFNTEQVNELINPKYIVPMHIPTATFASTKKMYADAYPNCVFYEKSMESEVFESTVAPVQGQLEKRDDFTLSQNYPNPFNPSTTIQYSLQNLSHVLLKVFDISGNEVKSLVNEVQDSGHYSVIMNGHDLANGVYFYQLQTEEKIQTRKCILLK